MHKTKAGFTLLEVIIVMVLLSLLVSLVGVRIVQQSDRAKERLARTMVKGGSLAQALDRFYLDNGFYPTTAQGLQALIEKPSGAPEPTEYDEEGYLDEIPEDPWKLPYQYRSPGESSRKGYDLWSMGRDRQSGTQDDIGNWPSEKR
jgi:general secretion pathway protein G